MLSTAPDFRSAPATLEAPAWYLPLPDITLSLASGPDTERFLQGQLSCNLQNLSASRSLRGALCTLKGRVTTDLMLVKANEGVLLLTWHGMHSRLIATLDKYRVFFKTTLQAADPAIRVAGLGALDEHALETAIGFQLPKHADQAVQAGAMTIVRLPNAGLLTTHPARFLVLVDTRVDAGKSLDSLHQRLPQLSSESWHLADIRDGIVHVTPEQSEIYTPQLLNYDINGIIDFKKGCYTGQEIVARMYYRAEAKRRLYFLNAQSTAAFGDATTDLSVEDVVVQQRLADGSVEALVILPVDVAASRQGVKLLPIASQ